MAAKINWHRYGTKLRECHRVHTDLHEARYKLYIDAIAIPAICDVLRVADGATLQSYAVTLGHRRVPRRRHEIDVACIYMHSAQFALCNQPRRYGNSHAITVLPVIQQR